MVVAVMLTCLVLSIATILGTQTPAPNRTFDIASIKLNTSNERARINAVPESGRLTITAMGVHEVIQSAYGIQSFELITIDSPVLKQKVDITAKTSQPVKSAAELQQLLQPLLAERFKLVVHREMREMNALVLTLANKDGRLGPKIKKTDSRCDALGTGSNGFARTNETAQGDRAGCGIRPTDGPGRIVAVGIDIATLAGLLAPSQRRPVLDQTGLEGRYDIDVTYTPEIFSAATLALRGTAPPPNVDPNGPNIFAALQDQLGLKLESKRAPVPVVVIDRIESLVEN